MKLPSIRSALLRGHLLLTVASASLLPGADSKIPSENGASQEALNLKGPTWVYDNWGVYEPTTIVNTPLTEEVALKQVEQIARLQRQGVHFDYYMMNGFWFDPDGGYIKWNQHWPNGPDRWIEACRKIGVTPGMWFAPNLLWMRNLAPEWQESFSGPDHRAYGTAMNGSLSLFEGRYLADFMKALQHWYDRGVRLFEFDMLDLEAATPASRAKLSKVQIRERNKEALMQAVGEFRQRNPDALIVGFNGLGFSKSVHPVDVDWLKVFETYYAGDLRVTNVPQASYWRSTDQFGDERVRLSEQNGVPLRRSDTSSIVFSETSFVDFRKRSAWKGMVLQQTGRGSWKQTVYGSLEWIKTDEDARWFAKVQQLYNPLLAKGTTRSIGPRPVTDQPEREPYGYVSYDDTGAIFTVVNPAHDMRTVKLENYPGPLGGGRILFSDAGFVPVLAGDTVTLGPGQLAVMGFNRYASQEFDLGIQHDIVIPKKIEPMAAIFQEVGPNTFEATISPPKQGSLRIIFQQFTPDGKPLKLLRYPVLLRYPLTTDMQPRQGPIMDTGLRIQVWQPGTNLRLNQDQPTTPPGISWALAETRPDEIIPGRPVTIRCTSDEARPAVFKARVYSVEY